MEFRLHILIRKRPGSGPAQEIPVDAATNRLSGLTYDLNGNPTLGVGGQSFYDVENRMVQAHVFSAEPEIRYAYDPWGKRVWRWKPSGCGLLTDPQSDCEIYFYGVTGQRLTTFNFGYWLDGDTWSFTHWFKSRNVYFGGRLLQSKGVDVQVDRLGSVK